MKPRVVLLHADDPRLVWRSRYLAALGITNSGRLAARHARISHTTALAHESADPEFAAQVEEAREHAIEMLHARVWQRTLEGDIEPVVYMGVVVGHVRKFDSKLQIEMLRAYRPDRFKTPEEQRHKLQEITKRRLDRINAELLTEGTPTKAEE